MRAGRGRNLERRWVLCWVRVWGRRRWAARLPRTADGPSSLPPPRPPAAPASYTTAADLALLTAAVLVRFPRGQQLADRRRCVVFAPAAEAKRATHHLHWRLCRARAPFDAPFDG